MRASDGAEHNREASRFEWTGTHNGEFLGIPATGRPVRVWGVVIDHPEDDRIKDTSIIMDTFGMMAQLGVLPSPPTPSYALGFLDFRWGFSTWPNSRLSGHLPFSSASHISSPISRFFGQLTNYG